MVRHRLVLGLATGLSLLLHLVLLGGDRFFLPRLAWQDDDVLASRPVTTVPRVRLLRTPAATATAAIPGTARGVPAPETTGAPPRASRVRGSLPLPLVPEDRPASAAVTQATTQDTPAEHSATASAAAGTPPPAEAAPTFPVQLSAQLEARLGSHQALLRQTWLMEGLRYAIEVRAEPPAPSLQLSSEGAVHPEGGLTLSRSALLVRQRLQSLTEYVPGRITLGGPVHRQSHPLPVVPQDLATLPFQLAVTFTGQPQTVFVSSGTALHQVRFTLLAEETLRLPAGTVRTLRVSGEQFHQGLRQMVKAYDVWLAPDFLNFPVKVSGHLPDGTPFGYRVLALDIEGRRVLGPLLAGTAAGASAR